LRLEPAIDTSHLSRVHSVGFLEPLCASIEPTGLCCGIGSCPVGLSSLPQDTAAQPHGLGTGSKLACTQSVKLAATRQLLAAKPHCLTTQSAQLTCLPKD